MQCPVSDPKQPDVISARVLRPQVLRCRPKVVGYGPTPAVNIDGDVFPVVVHLDLRTDVSLVYLVAESRDLIPGPGWELPVRRVLRVRWHVCVSHPVPVQRRTHTPASLPLPGSLGTTRKPCIGPKHGGVQLPLASEYRHKARRAGGEVTHSYWLCRGVCKMNPPSAQSSVVRSASDDFKWFAVSHGPIPSQGPEDLWQHSGRAL